MKSGCCKSVVLYKTQSNRSSNGDIRSNSLVRFPHLVRKMCLLYHRVSSPTLCIITSNPSQKIFACNSVIILSLNQFFLCKFLFPSTHKTTETIMRISEMGASIAQNQKAY